MSRDRSHAANRLLASLPEDEYQRLEPHLTSVQLPVNTVLYEASEKIETVYFPNTAIISIVSILSNGATTEVGLVGGTGMVGLPVIVGSGYSRNRAIVQAPNEAMKISAKILQREFERGEELQKLLLRYIESRLNEVAQLAVCNAHHTIEERMATWLLTTRDLIQSDNLNSTQEFLSQMLGVRRAGVTITAQILKRAGMISYSRGRIQILDCEALKNTTCECYQLFYDNYHRQQLS
ncbi:Crp/Fnr family transcriptional regulator [Myxosarcina sp. GI1(2024)]